MKTRLNSIRLLPAIGLLLLTIHVFATEPGSQPAPIISACDKPFVFGFGSWDKAPKTFAVNQDGVRISTADAKGGAGWAGISVNLGDRGDWSPALRLVAGEKHKAQALNLHVADADGTSHSYRFDLGKLKPAQTAPGDMTAPPITAEYGASLIEPQKVDKPGETPGLDLANITLLMVIGDWSGNAVDVQLSGIVLVPPTDELRAQRAKLREIKAKEAQKARREAEAKEQARKDLLTNGAPHPVDRT